MRQRAGLERATHQLGALRMVRTAPTIVVVHFAHVHRQRALRHAPRLRPARNKDGDDVAVIHKKPATNGAVRLDAVPGVDERRGAGAPIDEPHYARPHAARQPRQRRCEVLRDDVALR